MTLQSLRGVIAAVATLFMMTAAGCGTKSQSCATNEDCASGYCDPDRMVCATMPDAATGPDAPVVDADPTPDAPTVACDGNEDCQTPPGNCLEAGTCNLDTGECVFPPTDCSSLDGECAVGVCNTQSGDCEALPTNESDICGDGTVCGDFGACGGFVDSCDETGTQTHSCTDHTCQSGTCTASAPYDETQNCMIDTDGSMCSVDVVDSCGSCGSFTSTCDESGTMSCTCRSYSCVDGTCTESASSCTQDCTRDTDGNSCGTDPAPDNCTTCSYTGGTCDESGSQDCTCYSRECSSGSCTNVPSACTPSCSRVRDGLQCGTQSNPTVCGANLQRLCCSSISTTQETCTVECGCIN